jgi:AbrB family looped-hinge helix DNA binding protein
MKNTVTITSKGQTTIPAPLRRKLGLNGNTGGVLDIRYDESKGELIISKPLGLDDLSKKLSGYIKPGVKPLVDADTYYQANRAG